MALTIPNQQAIANAQAQRDYYNQSSMIGGSYGQTMIPSFPQPSEMNTETMRAMILKFQAEIDRRELHTKQDGPTNHEMNTHPTLKHAWEEYRVVRKLLGL